jgi:hypothetical protein
LKLFKLAVLATAIGLSGCGDSHLDCDTEENEAYLKNTINYIFTKYLEVGAFTGNIHDDAYPEIDITSFSQQKVDSDAKRCTYIIDAHFKADNTHMTDIPVTVVFRNNEEGEDTHTMVDFDMDQGTVIGLGLAAVQNNLLLNKNN